MKSHLKLPAVPALTDQPSALRRLAPEDLVEGPAALPVAPMSMPAQQIEPDLRLSTRLARMLTRRPVGEGT
ncbi:hypothetical protein BMG03_03130 [Thioclava nitratireducens]|uniref:Uncharacterized protein n=1 Tax=Thioclava nitratireducens TaxID=1915078 RepID=A0ABM6IE08_9RHOB|nr:MULTISPECIES: hypothetical protein [Thioclava]AQS46900.1 hypothetical protein BMG03_03130 [Thioclava nitratireducens]PWE49486.1 hypothetical protein DEM26_13665 [Thioclava sp. NG1]